MAVKIMIHRMVPEDKVQEIMPFLEKLHSVASRQPGYIYGETLKSLDKQDEYLVISTWRSLAEWERWANSSERLSIQNKIDKLIGSKTEYRAYQH